MLTVTNLLIVQLKQSSEHWNKLTHDLNTVRLLFGEDVWPAYNLRLSCEFLSVQKQTHKTMPIIFTVVYPAVPH